ncbi:hypothetical protein C0Q70_11068 [Pomacea canaliculata]|uniref:Uncharacterized protein n=1 Tax=Pomacea canaliculata TaxID=400727 RepID=A0A2T7P4Z3_POMCA|nr:hypothetical protein C0Q70_11068 [Pomacea canaliculata]
MLHIIVVEPARRHIYYSCAPHALARFSDSYNVQGGLAPTLRASLIFTQHPRFREGLKCEAPKSTQTHAHAKVRTTPARTRTHAHTPMLLHVAEQKDDETEERERERCVCVCVWRMVEDGGGGVGRGGGGSGGDSAKSLAAKREDLHTLLTQPCV